MKIKKLCSFLLAAVLCCSMAMVPASAKSVKDRSGNTIVLPKEVNTIVSMAPSTTQVLIDMGLADKIVAVDTNSKEDFASQLNADVQSFDMMNPDNEAIVALDPDIVFTSGMSSTKGDDAFQAVRDADICVADIPSSTSLKGIEKDITFIGRCVKEKDEAEDIVDDMEDEIEDIKDVAKTIKKSDRKTVLFELSLPSDDSPTIYTAGKKTYIDEMITTIGAKNATHSQKGWISVSEEEAVAMDPDVIITNVDYTDDPVSTSLADDGWQDVEAIVKKQVYSIDTDTSSRPNQHVVDAMIEMAKDVYPEEYANFGDDED